MFQRVFQCIVVYCFYAYLLEVIDFAEVILFGVLDHAVKDVCSCRRIVRIQEVPGSVHPVLSGNVGVFFTLIGVPLHAFSDLEGPHETVIRDFPRFRQCGSDDAEMVVFDETVYYVGCDGKLCGCGSD